MIIMSFDLSTACIGVVTARINNKSRRIEVIKSCPIIPPKFTPSVLGYNNSKKKLPTKGGEMLNTYWINGETVITKAEKERRDNQVRAQKDIYVLEHIGKTIGTMLQQIKPDLVIVEKNSAFNGILTTVLLAKVMGGLVNLAGLFGIPLKEYPVAKVRKHFNVSTLVKEFVTGKTDEELQKIPDITKRALREFLQKKYGHLGIQFQTDDESDACVVFDYWYNHDYEEAL